MCVCARARVRAALDCDVDGVAEVEEGVNIYNSGVYYVQYILYIIYIICILYKYGVCYIH